MGVTAMAIARVFDSAYAVLTGKAGALLSRRRLVPVSRASGLCLIGGGVWLALRPANALPLQHMTHREGTGWLVM
jgi:homoserine/homoserine lactone efflux protein